MDIAVIGLGKLGLPLACLQAQKHTIIGVDLDQKVVDKVNAGVSPIIEPDVPGLLLSAIAKGHLKATTEISDIYGTDMSLIIVPTPSLKSGRFSSKFVLKAIVEIGHTIRDQGNRHVVVVCSTVMPGECDGVIRTALEQASGKEVGGLDVGLVYGPQFIALGSVIHDMQNAAVAIIGASDIESQHTYASIIPPGIPHRYMSLTSAEIAKIALNAYVTMKISFANTLGEISENVPGADAYQITEAIGMDPRVGSSYILPGGPYSGPCFPRDNRAFAVFAEDWNVSAPLSEATDVVNNRQISRTIEHIKTVGNNRVGILGMTYKVGTPSTEESFGLKLAKQLIFLGYEVIVNDPALRVKPEELPEEAVFSLRPEACFSNRTTTVLATPDPGFQDLFPLVFSDNDRTIGKVIDCWNLLAPSPWHETHIIRLGVGSAA